MSLLRGLVLGIESSCDESSAAVLKGRLQLSNVISSQAKLHEKWGGVVPEAASRAHIEAMIPVVDEAISLAGVKLQEIEAIAVTCCPGLIGALSVGVSCASALGFVLKIPVIGVHHLEGHLLSGQCLLESGTKDFEFDDIYPQLCLIVSGGHTELILIQKPGHYEILAETRDDAAGEAFDKGARLLGLPYPGGFMIQEEARKGNPKRYQLPIGLRHDAAEFSFSGLKTATLRLVEKEGAEINIQDAAASLQRAIVRALSMKVEMALNTHSGSIKSLGIGGGVASNESLREVLSEIARKFGLPFIAPHTSFCTDNAAMIALAGSFWLANGAPSPKYGQIDIQATAPLPRS